jgi:hypothetical protein
MTNRNPRTDETTPSNTTTRQPAQSNLRDYENGYADGHLHGEENEANALSNGFLWAFLIFVLGGVGFFSYMLFFNQNQQVPAEQNSPAAAPVVIPQPQQTTIVQPTKETQIIERTVEKAAPASPAVEAPPQINIQVPPVPVDSPDASSQNSEPLDSPSPEATSSPDPSAAESP